MKELTTEQKAKAYDKVSKEVKDFFEGRHKMYSDVNQTLEYLFPELVESEDEKIRKGLIKLVQHTENDELCCEYGHSKNDFLTWLEKQGKETCWKPSKEEMDVLYGLAYITNQFDEHKEEVITRLYQDLKREFFNGSSYENMFPTNTSTEDDVRRRNTIQVLEYARSLDTYNQYGKADIDKNIAWLEKQVGRNLLIRLNQSSEGEWVVFNNHHDSVYQIEKIKNYEYTLRHFLGGSMPLSFSHEDMIRAWTIQDAKDGDVLCTYECDEPKIVFILKGTPKIHYALGYHYYYNIMYPHFESDSEKGCLASNDEDIKPATKEQRELLFQKMKEAGYEWDAEKKELKKIENTRPMLSDFFNAENEKGKVDALKGVKWSKEDENVLNGITSYLCTHDACELEGFDKWYNWLKSLKERVQSQPKQEWSEDDIVHLNNCISFMSGLSASEMNWLKSLKDRAQPQSQWKPTEDTSQLY